MNGLEEPSIMDPLKAPPKTINPFVAIDLDGTLAEGIWTPENPTSEIGRPRWRNVAKAGELKANGWRIAIHTARPWGDYVPITNWCRFWMVPFDIVVCGKILAAAYIDDRAIHESVADWTPHA